MIFCTLFNVAYLPQGLSLYWSLLRTIKGKFTLYILCMDEVTFDVLSRSDLANVKLIKLPKIEDAPLLAVKSTRSFGEYCWTCTTPLLLYVMDRHPVDTVVTYVDADIAFFSDPRVILDELGAGSIFIHEHRFAPGRQYLLESAGRFNVGVAAFRNNHEGRMCLNRWRAQCIDECSMDPAAGKCGDQKYLDEWPSLYDGLVISKNPGVGLGPWNLEAVKIHKHQGVPHSDGFRVIFYHYHSLRLLKSYFGLRPVYLVRDYIFCDSSVEIIHRIYTRELWKAVRFIEKRGVAVQATFRSLSDVRSEFDNRQIMLSFLGLSVPMRLNGRVITKFYG